ncbi:MAG: GNAT family N-acetyltransferase, partial [Lachnospiraceae bacterium]|nr:GNAT family N-acetyltransferase [Lachnospiraceae bacterium]
DEENRGVGQFIMRYLHGDTGLLRFGWVIVDNTNRGTGYGTEMRRLGLQYAFGILRVDKVTLGVFEGNDLAHNCYRKAGFSDTGVVVEKQPWNVIEMEITKEKMMR